MTFFVRYATRSFAPPRSVSILTPINGWENIENANRKRQADKFKREMDL